MFSSMESSIENIIEVKQKKVCIIRFTSCMSCMFLLRFVAENKFYDRVLVRFIPIFKNLISTSYTIPPAFSC